MEYIKSSNLPPRIGAIPALVWWLFSDRISAPGWAYGVIGTLLAIMYAFELFRTLFGESVDVLK